MIDGPLSEGTTSLSPLPWPRLLWGLILNNPNHITDYVTFLFTLAMLRGVLWSTLECIRGRMRRGLIFNKFKISIVVLKLWLEALPSARYAEAAR